MKRQLYYLLPDLLHTKLLCHDLEEINISNSNIQAVIKDKIEIDEIPNVHSINEIDRDHDVESLFWYFTIVIFCLSLVAFTGMLFWQPSLFLLIPAGLMLFSIFMACYFILKIPNVHWSEFKNAIPHGEILLIIDVPKIALEFVDRTIHRRHPEALNGGVCWKL